VASTVAFAPGWEERYNRQVERAAFRPLCELILADMERGCPEDKGDLKDSLRIRYLNQHGARIGSDLDYATVVELGSGPHIIRAKGNYSLHNAETGEYFGPVVMHPGTPAQPFMRPALYRRRSL